MDGHSTPHYRTDLLAAQRHETVMPLKNRRCHRNTGRRGQRLRPCRVRSKNPAGLHRPYRARLLEVIDHDAGKGISRHCRDFQEWPALSPTMERSSSPTAARQASLGWTLLRSKPRRCSRPAPGRTARRSSTAPALGIVACIGDDRRTRHCKSFGLNDRKQVSIDLPGRPRWCVTDAERRAAVPLHPGAVDGAGCQPARLEPGCAVEASVRRRAWSGHRPFAAVASTPHVTTVRWSRSTAAPARSPTSGRSPARRMSPSSIRPPASSMSRSASRDWSKPSIRAPAAPCGPMTGIGAHTTALVRTGPALRDFARAWRNSRSGGHLICRTHTNRRTR